MKHEYKTIRGLDYLWPRGQGNAVEQTCNAFSGDGWEIVTVSLDPTNPHWSTQGYTIVARRAVDAGKG